MRRSVPALTATLIVGALVSWPALADAAECSELLRRFQRAVQAKALDQVRTLEGAILLDVCAEASEVVIPRSELELEIAEPLKGRGAYATERGVLLASANRPALNWRAGRELGDHYFGLSRFVDATRTYEATIELIKNRTATVTAPPQREILSLINKANQARMLAANEEDKGQTPVFVSTRDAVGKVGGGFSGSVRGVVAKIVPIPIQFETGQAVLTPTGLKAATELVSALKQQEPPVIRLVGHTDERGAADYNMVLSERRVRAVEAYLRENGVKGRIEVDWKGKSQPLALEIDEGLTRELVWALNRRVEWIRE